MAKPLLPDELRGTIGPLSLGWSPSPEGGQPRVPDRNALTGILFVLNAGLLGEDLPCEMNCGRGMTCWRRLRDRQPDDSGDRIPKVLHGGLRGVQKIDWSRALVDSRFVRAAYFREATGTSPVDRADPGREHHLLSGADGIPLDMRVTEANADDTSPERCRCSVPSRRWRSSRPGRGDCNA